MKSLSSSDELIPFCIGSITKPHGLHGFIKLMTLKDSFIDVLTVSTTIYLDDTPYIIENIKHQAKRVLVKLSSINNFEDANELRDKEVFVDKKIIENLFTTNKVFFCENWLNHNVYSEQGELLGIVNDIIYTAGNDVISVINDKEETLIPVVSDYILSEDTKKATLTVKKPEYL